MKKFLEKRWWGGISVIVALVLGVPALIQYLGDVNISWLTVTIILSVILAIALILVTIWNIRLKRKYEDVINRIAEIQENMKEFERQSKKFERQRVWLPDPEHIWKLNVDNALLSQLHGQAHGLAIKEFHDAKLSGLSIIVHPYREDKVSILFRFYSQWAKRQCTYLISEKGDIQEALPTKPSESSATFDELPWLRHPNWPQFLRKSCEKTGPLSQAEWTMYHLSAYAEDMGERPWDVSFEDGMTGKDYNFTWDGK